MSEKVVVSRGLAVAVFEGLGIPTAKDWPKAKMQSKLDSIHDMVPDGTLIGDPEKDQVLNKLVGCREMSGEIEVISDEAFAERFPEGNPDFQPEEWLEGAAERAEEKKAADEAAAKEAAEEAAKDAEFEAEEAKKEAAEAEKEPEKPKKDGKKGKSEGKKVEDAAEKDEKKAETAEKPPKKTKIRGTESYHAGIALRETKAAQPEGEGDEAKGGDITEATWTHFYGIHGDAGKKSRKGFMGAARQAVRAFLGHKSDREKPSKAYQCGQMIRENKDVSFEEMAAKLDGSTSENKIIAKKAIQALTGYGLLELAE